MKTISADRLSSFISTLAGRYEVLLPILLPDGTRVIGSPENGPPALHGGAVTAKPTAAFFPQHDQIFTASEGEFATPSAPDRPLFVAGFTSNDLACLHFIDRFFADGWRDDLYFRRRQGAIVAGVSGYCGPEEVLLPPAGGNCDLEFFWSGSIWLVIPYSEAGMAVAEELKESTDPEVEALFLEAAAQVRSENEILIQRASELLRADKVPDSFWSEIGDRCIACTGCNLACPTCTCFGVQDWRSTTLVDRSRMWDSCQLDGFMREASGHNPLGSEALRTRRRIHHKLAADPEKWGEISCFNCGRCDAVCPTGIGMVSVVRELVARFGYCPHPDQK